MNTGLKDKPRRLNRYDLILWLTILIVFTALETVFAPGARQPLLSLALGALLLSFFVR